jgi:malonate decarboxylase delta subunit
VETLTVALDAPSPLPGEAREAIVGVVASGNLEILAERCEPPHRCTVAIETAVAGFGPVWREVVRDFVERASPGGVRFSVNDGGARPDTVMLRLMQAARALERAGEDAAP